MQTASESSRPATRSLLRSLVLGVALACAAPMGVHAAPSQSVAPGSVGETLLNWARGEGIEVRGAVQALSQPAPGTSLPADANAALNVLLKGQQFVVKRAVIDGTPRIVQVTVLSGTRGAAPAPLPVTTASATPSPAQPAPAVTAPQPPETPTSRTTSLLQTAALQQGTGSTQSGARPAPPPARNSEPPPNFNTAPPQLTPEQQAALARMTQQASSDLTALVTALENACPAGATC